MAPRSGRIPVLVAVVCLLAAGTVATAARSDARPTAPQASRIAAYAWLRGNQGAGTSWLPLGSDLYRGRAHVDVVIFLPSGDTLLFDIALAKRPGGWKVVAATHSVQDCHVGFGRVDCAGD